MDGTLKFSHVVSKIFSERRYKKCIKTAGSEGGGSLKLKKKMLLIDVMSSNFENT